MNDAPPNDSATQSGHPGTDSFFDNLRRIDMRRSEDGWIGGVAAGIAHRLGLDPIVIRAGFVLLGLVFGIGLLVYLAAWLLIPDTRDRTHLERAMREGDGTSIVLLVFAVIVAFSSLPWWGGDRGFYGGWGGWWFVGLLLLSLLFWGGWTAWERREAPGSMSRMTGSTGPTSPPPPPPGTPGTPGAGAQTGGPTYTGHPGPAPAGPSGPTAMPPVAPAPRPKRRAGGAVAGLIATGLALVTYGSLDWAARTYDWPGSHYVIAVAGTLAVLGAVVLVLGLAGRRSGFPGFLAGMALFVTAVTAPLPENISFVGGVGDREWTPTAVTELEPFRLGIGEGSLDLRGLDLTELDGEEVVASVGIGQLNVIVPEEMTVRVRANSAVGAVNLRESDFGVPDRSTGGAGVSEDRLLGTGEPDLVLDLNVGVGEINLERN